MDDVANVFRAKPYVMSTPVKIVVGGAVLTAMVSAILGIHGSLDSETIVNPTIAFGVAGGCVALAILTLAVDYCLYRRSEAQRRLAAPEVPAPAPEVAVPPSWKDELNKWAQEAKNIEVGRLVDNLAKSTGYESYSSKGKGFCMKASIAQIQCTNSSLKTPEQARQFREQRYRDVQGALQAEVARIQQLPENEQAEAKEALLDCFRRNYGVDLLYKKLDKKHLLNLKVLAEVG